ncbi:hypothetical protein DB346_22640 [Verrucomicrobia bacterium LW23]|nr:hypothetical protein DB346_22640 [Verrucomicrobia bacterium LW23]
MGIKKIQSSNPGLAEPMRASIERLARLSRAKKRYISDVGTPTRLGDFMKADPGLLSHYTRLVSENPRNAVRLLMLNDMRRHYQEMAYVSKALANIRTWLADQPKEVQHAIRERISTVAPIYRDKALLREANKLRYSEKPRNGINAS